MVRPSLRKEPLSDCSNHLPVNGWPSGPSGTERSVSDCPVEPFSISETCYRYQPKLSDENEQIADHLLALTKAKEMWGFGLRYMYLRNVKGFGWNHKRVYRIYRELELNMRIIPRKRLQRERPEPLARA